MIGTFGIWVICEGSDQTHLELIAKACELSSAGQQVVALQVSDLVEPSLCIQSGADIVLSLESLAQDACSIGNAIACTLAKYEPEIALFPATVQGRMLSAWVAGKLETGLTADCTDLKRNLDGLLLQTRPAFGGNLIADILCKVHRPQMASVRPKVFAKPELDKKRKGMMLTEEYHGKPYVMLCNAIDITEQSPLSEAEIIVAGGKGIGSKAGFARIARLAQLLGGAVGATRSAVDAGYIDYAHQIGQTGVTVRPKLYIAVGISGVVQHIVGMNNADIVIAINSDPRATIFSYADYGVVADWNVTIDDIMTRLERKRANELQENIHA